MFGLLSRAFTTFTQLPTFTVPWDRNPLMEPLREAPEPEATRPFPFTFTRPSNHYMLPHPEPDLTNAAIFGAVLSSSPFTLLVFLTTLPLLSPRWVPRLIMLFCCRRPELRWPLSSSYAICFALIGFLLRAHRAYQSFLFRPVYCVLCADQKFMPY